MNSKSWRCAVFVVALAAFCVLIGLSQGTVQAGAESETGVSENKSEENVAANEVFSPLELELLSLINEVRQENDLLPLKVNPVLAKVARQHAVEMIEYDYFSHRSPYSGSPAARVRTAGLSVTRVGENLAGNTCVTNAHEMLMSSRAHRGNVLSDSYAYIGLGVVKGGRYGKMIVQVFTDNIDK